MDCGSGKRVAEPTETAWYARAMGNPFGITLDDASLRWAATDAASESATAAICLVGEMRVDEIVAKLTTAELEQVIKIVGRTPSCYPPGVYAALKDKRGLGVAAQQADRPPNIAPREQVRPSRTVAAEKRAKPPRKAAALRQQTAEGENRIR